MSLLVEMFPCLRDNYGFLLHDEASGLTATVDTPEAGPIIAALERRGWRLDYILNTHHHADHAGGNLELKDRTGCTVVGAQADAARIPGIDIGLAEGDEFMLGESRAVVLETPGHTRGHIVFHFPDEGQLFAGDTLFVMGCGRLFEGTPAEMWDSLQKLVRLPDSTRVWCAHEYTQANARFALTIEPDNLALRERAAEVDTLRAAGRPTVPSTIGREKATNPFLRPASPLLRARLAMPEESEVAVFAETRRRKDSF
ncbi:MAG: hydroxyacylglutathione hydrolase [Chromatiales bacterium]|nr:hydroxyacylglutathione hydrolase [Chromatiales bacterium]